MSSTDRGPGDPAPARARRSGLLRVVLVNLAVLAAGVAAIELFMGTWFSGAHALYAFTQPRDYVHRMANPLPYGPPEIVYSRDGNGFRNLDGPVDAIDLVVVGGSTTDQRWIDDSETYEAVLRDRFRADGRHFVVANAGIDGQSTFGHLEAFRSWFPNVPGFRTRHMLFYVGLNDMLRIEPGGTYDRVEADSARLRAQLYVRERSVFYQAYLVLKSAYRAWREPDRAGHTLTRLNIADRPPLTTERQIADLRTPKILGALEAFRGRLRRLAELTREIGAEPIFVTQRSARWTRTGGRIIGIAEYTTDFFAPWIGLPEPNGVDFHELERLYADAVMEECAAAGAICLDLMAGLEFDLARDFYDSVHTTSPGARAIGLWLHDRLVDSPAFR